MELSVQLAGKFHSRISFSLQFGQSLDPQPLFILLVDTPKSLPNRYVSWISDLLIASFLPPEVPEPPPPSWGKYFNLEDILQFSIT